MLLLTCVFGGHKNIRFIAHVVHMPLLLGNRAKNSCCSVMGGGVGEGVQATVEF